jgi:hypothetical protein
MSMMHFMHIVNERSLKNRRLMSLNNNKALLEEVC